MSRPAISRASRGDLRCALTALCAVVVLMGATAAHADQVTLGSDGKSTFEQINNWAWNGNELGDLSDGTVATVGAQNRELRSSLAYDAVLDGATISQVDFYVRAGGNTEAIDWGPLVGGTDYLPVAQVTVATGLADLAPKTWTTNPATTAAWTPAEIQSLEVVAQSKNNGGWGGTMSLAEIWVVVTYTPGVANTPPTVTITAPPDLTTANEGTLLTFIGTAADTEDGDISAGLSWTSSLQGAIGSGASFSISTLSLGTHTITASVTDSGGLSDSDQITVTILNVAPTVTITAPADGSSFSQGASVGFTGTATDPGDGDLSASLSWASNLDGAIGSGASFSISSLSVGSHTITASVSDGDGLGGSDQITVTILNVAPTVTITAPADGSSFSQGASVGFTGTATDPGDGDLSASLSWTSSLDGVIGSGASFSTSTLSAGSHTITASVTDGDGAGGSDQITVTVVPPANDVTPGAASAIVTGCDRITVSAPFTGDVNGDSTTLFEWSPGGAGTWATVAGCAAVSGGSPRTCVHSGLTELTAYDYRVSFSDPDNAPQPTPEVIGPYATTQCSANDTTVSSTTAEASSCSQITVSSVFFGDGNSNGSTTVEYKLSSSGTWLAACSGDGPSPRQCLISELVASSAYDIRVTFADPDGVFPNGDADPNSEVFTATGSPVTTPACTGDGSPPTVIILSPATDAVLGGIDVARVQVWDPDGVTVEWSVDSENDADLSPASVNANYGCGADCAIYEFNLNTTSAGVDPQNLINGPHYLTIKAGDGAGNVARAKRAFQVNNNGTVAAGAGTLLRRTHGSQLCIDCHNLSTHSSQATSTGYGNWGIDCLSCHSPHGTRNIYLVGETIQTPSTGSKVVDFRTLNGRQDNSFASVSAPGTGLCETCHTRTDYYREDGTGAGHASGNCIGCHTHDGGFSGGGGGCDNCHFAPPTVGKHTSHDEVAAVPTGYADTTPTTTATLYGFACAKCHSGAHFSDSNTPHTVEVVFDTSALPDNTSGTYAPDGGSQATDPGVNGDGWYWSDGSCGNLYCHSNAAPLGGANSFQTVTWDQAAALGCASCHDGGGAASNLSAAHAGHTNAGEYNLGCVRCHDATVSNNTTVDDKRNHVNGVKDVLFDASGANNSGGSYDDTGHTCSSTYCHSDGKDQVAPFVSGPSIAWDATATCASCHDDADPTATGLSGAHFTHTETDGYSLGCERCHIDTVSDSATISTFSNHTNVLQDVFFDSAGVNNSGGSYNAGGETCSNTYCHSNGTDLVAPYTTAASIVWGDSRSCFSCHGSSGDGSPDYANGSPKANSHVKHVASYACNVCHSTVVDATPTITAKALHVNGAYNVAAGGGYTFTPSGSPTTCATNGCHGDLTWGQTGIGCRNCHSASGAGNQDIDDWVYGNGITARIDIDDWASYGHGNTTAYTESGTSGADLDGGGADGCLYCHAAGVGHDTAANPFRLANLGAGTTAEDKNAVCTVCHGGAGFNPGSGSVDSSLDVDAYHYGADHGGPGGEEGGTFCWDCHDPHGDFNYGLGQRLAYMVDETPTEDHSGATGWGVPTLLAGTPDFRSNRDGTAAWGWGDYVNDNSPADNTGVCQTCHDSGDNVANFTKTVYTASHNPGSRCTLSCHTHDQPPSDAFKGAGTCLDCHETDAQSGAYTRRAVGADFDLNSHHVGSGGTNMGGALTNFDCIVCHAEGWLDTAPNPDEVKTSNDYHGGNAGGATTIDLRDVDNRALTRNNTGDVFSYDKDTGMPGAVAEWNSSSIIWSTQTRTTLDPFCLTCHDADGANLANVGSNDNGGSSSNPFGDDAITNEYDEQDRTAVVDIKSMVTHDGVDRDTEAVRNAQNIPDPPEGVYSRHAISGQSASVYTSQNIPNARWNQTKVSWNDVSVMSCADCHTSDGANGADGNAHGANTEYMLKNADGLATAEAAESEYGCFLCHDAGTYDTGHTNGNASDFAHTSDATGNARLGDDGSIFGISCVNCHGGFGFGRIHGTTQTFGIGVNGGSGTREAYRFTNGGSLRYFDPGNWGALGGNNNDMTCYTLSSPDSFGGCTEHGGSGKSKERTLIRPVGY